MPLLDASTGEEFPQRSLPRAGGRVQCRISGPEEITVTEACYIFQSFHNKFWHDTADRLARFLRVQKNLVPYQPVYRETGYIANTFNL